MKGAKYQRLAMQKHGVLPTIDGALSLCGLGVAGEAGEIADSIKKILHHDHDLDVDHLIEEAGDCLWYLALLCETLGKTLDDVMARNIAKLEKRYPTGFDPERSKNREQE